MSKQQMQMVKVYIIRCGDLQYYKIGIAINIRKRMTNLQHANPLRLTLVVKSSPFSLEKCRKIERALHRFNKKYRLRGEWFGLNEYQFRKTKERLDELSKRKYVEKISDGEERKRYLRRVFEDYHKGGENTAIALLKEIKKEENIKQIKDVLNGTVKAL